MEVDPGAHEVLVGTPRRSQGRAHSHRDSIEAKEKKRLAVTFLKEARPPPPLAEPAPARQAGESDDLAPARPTPRRWPFYAGVGVGAADLVGTAVLAARESSERSDLDLSCTPACTDAQRTAFRRDDTLMKLSIGTGVAGVALSAVWLSRATVMSCASGIASICGSTRS